MLVKKFASAPALADHGAGSYLANFARARRIAHRNRGENVRAGKAILALVVVAACRGGGNRVEVAAGAGGPLELGSSMNVRVLGDTVRFEMHITNATGSQVAVSFRSAQRYDFVVTRGSGEEVWRASSGMMFAQVATTETLSAGETKRFEASWIARGQTGDYVATARLTSTNYPVELRTVFRLPAE
jgi:hypothetical protein